MVIFPEGCRIPLEVLNILSPLIFTTDIDNGINHNEDEEGVGVLEENLEYSGFMKRYGLGHGSSVALNMKYEGYRLRLKRSLKVLMEYSLLTQISHSKKVRCT